MNIFGHSGPQLGLIILYETHLDNEYIWAQRPYFGHRRPQTFVPGARSPEFLGTEALTWAQRPLIGPIMIYGAHLNKNKKINDSKQYH